MWGGYPVRRGIVKDSNGIIFNLITLLVVACVLSFIAGAAYTKPDKPVTMLSATSSDAIPMTSEPEEGHKAETNSESSDEWRIVRMRVTGYCPCAKCCGEFADGITACGHKIQPGDTFVAADKRYSFGTEMVIEGYSNSQTVKVLDRGGAIRGNKLDAFFHTHQEALEWGVKYIDVKVRDI